MDNGTTGKSRKEEGSNNHRVDREVKPKARSSDADAPVPGAHSLKAEHKSRTKSGKRSSGDSKYRSRSRKGDEKSDYRSSPRSPSSSQNATTRKRHEKSSPAKNRSNSGSVPGAHTELSSPRSRSRRDEKGKESRGSRATKPGAGPSTSSSGTKSSGRSKKRDIENLVNEEEGEPVVAAMIVEEEKEDEDAKEQREQARINEMVAAQTEKQRKQMEAEHRRMQRKQEEMERKQEEMERREAHREAKEKKKKRNMIICALLVVLLFGGGVAAFFALQAGSSSDDTMTQTTDQGEETPIPSSDSITDNPSSAPTSGALKYEQPGSIECERVAVGLPIDGEEEMVARTFDIFMEVVLVDGNDIDSGRVQELDTQIEKLFVPDLIGCPRDLFDERRLRHYIPPSNQSSGNMSLHFNHRQLQNVSIRYAIAKAMVTVTVTDDVCEKSSSVNCSVVAARLDLTVRGEEDAVFLAELILDIFPKDKDIRPDLELSAPFDTIIIGILRSLDPLPTPTIAPTGTGTDVNQNLSSAPSSGLSPSPTSPPQSGPTDPTPVVDATTPVPTKSPTKSPTVAPTMAPTMTPPTAAPQPGPSPAPTPPPTASPTIAASESPTKSPTDNPSATPSQSPSIQASAAPSPAPTSRPSSRPSSGPSSSPSHSPSSAPSFNPTAPTSNPSASPTSGPRLNFIPLLRRGMTFDQSSTYSVGAADSADTAFDGAYNTHSHTWVGTNQWWRANLQDFYGELVTVNKITVWNRQNFCCPERLLGSTVQLFGAGSDNLIAESAPLTSALVQTVDFGEVTEVQYFRIHQARNEWQNLAEVEAWGSIPIDTNNLGYTGLIKEGVSVEQSSTLLSDDAYGAPIAVDGNSFTFSSTDRPDNNQWWRANLQDFYGQLVTVNKVTVWNRADCCQERLEGATVKLFGAGTDNLIAESAPLTSLLIQTVDFGEVVGVQNVEVHLDRMEYLQLGEIEAWGKVR